MSFLFYRQTAKNMNCDERSRTSENLFARTTHGSAPSDTIHNKQNHTHTFIHTINHHGRPRFIIFRFTTEQHIPINPTMTLALSSYLPFVESIPCCGRTLPFNGMEIKVKNAIPKGMNLSGFKLDVTLSITNPNKTQVSAAGFTYNIAPKGKSESIIAEGNVDSSIVLSGGETTTVVVPASCSYGALGVASMTFLQGGGKIEFVMSGEHKYKIPMTETVYTLPYQVDGSFQFGSPAKNSE